MADFQSFYKTYLESLPPILAALTLVSVIGWTWWANLKRDNVGDKTLTSVSGSFKQLSDTQQARITQQDAQITRLEKLVTELQAQLTAALAEISRLCNVLEGIRHSAAFKDLKTIRTLRDDEGSG